MRRERVRARGPLPELRRDPLSRRDDAAYAAGLLLGIAVLVFGEFVAVREERYAVANDWTGIWAGARAILDGVDPYDATRWPAYAVSVQHQVPETAVYGYPAWVAIVLLPLGALPVRLASDLWAFGGLVVAAIAMRALLRANLAGLPAAFTLVGFALIGSQPAVVTFLDGQWSFVLVALLCVAALHPGRGVGGTAAALALLAKAQLFLFFAPAYARTSHRALGALAACVTLAVLVSLALFPRWPAAYASVIDARLPSGPRATTVAGALFGVFGDLGPLLAVFVLAIGFVTALRFDPRASAGLAVWLAFSVTAAPYTWSYDHLVLLVPLVLGAGTLAPRFSRRALALVIGGTAALLVASVLLHGLFAETRGRESYNAFIAIGMTAALMAMLWPFRHGEAAHLDLSR